MYVKYGQEETLWRDALIVRRAVFIDEQGVSEEEEIDAFEQTSIHFVLYDDDKPIAAGRFRTIDDVGKIERICVLPAYRGRGLGKRIMEAIEQYATKHVTKVKLNAQTHAEPFYKQLGYETVSDVFLDAGIPHVTMVKTINMRS
ncbi:acetyltransferase [Anoxybacillus gonensis]|uniref:GNAT family N-acetyltransferase n=1 Tax=Anoxybacillus gonensis TaxID=198467 RepID=A0AAW7TEG9_9BACL|nr:GNAT family N-acetyltransferase [Anoxybacillus gonensis]AKS37668.1 acetyltransferase [Anoxybacillus gonensis]KGP61590.1 acetyltransferase [Anoxybacillus gonensis]MDO0876514.1 GNAT family N-acetyltransferase [Anoxybacillus gonensis]